VGIRQTTIKWTAVLLTAVGVTLLASSAHAQERRDDRIHTHGLFLGIAASQLHLDSDDLQPPDEGQYGIAGRLGYGLGDYFAVVVSGDLARLDLTLDAQESEFEMAHIALSARLHPIRAWGRVGPFIEGSWVRYAATTDRAVAPATAKTRLTLEGTGAGAGAGLHVFLSRKLSLEASAAITDGRFTKATGAAAGDFDRVDLRSRLYRIGLTWWLGT
jgi:hypothetical protein